MKRDALRVSSPTMPQESGIPSRNRKPSGLRSQGPRERAAPAVHYQVPATVSAVALLDRGSDRQFRELVQHLLTVARRMEMARDYFGRLIDVTGPQYHLLMTVAQLQGAMGVSVGTVAQVMRVSSAFVASETGKLSSLGLLRKRPNPEDRRGALLSLTQAGRLKMDRLIPEIRAVNDRFFGRLDAHSFSELCAIGGALVQGSREAMRYTQRDEEETS